MMRKNIPASEWKEIQERNRLKRETPSIFLFCRYTCGACGNGIRFQSVWKYIHKVDKIHFGIWRNRFYLICKRCAPTREQLLSMSFNNNMKEYTEVKDLIPRGW